MQVALILGDLHYDSYAHGLVAGEEIDAVGMQSALLAREDVAACDLTTPNILAYLQAEGRLPHYDLAVHFHMPTILVAGSTNVLFFRPSRARQGDDVSSYWKIFDLVLSPSPELAHEYPEIRYLPLAADPDFYRPTEADESMRCQVLFVGNCDGREPACYAQYLRPAAELGLAIYGADWTENWTPPELSEFAPAWRGMLPMAKAPIAYASARISLAIHSEECRRRWQITSSRVYHSLACGRVVVSDDFPGLRSAFPEGSGVLYTAGDEQTADLIKAYLADGAAAAQLGEAGRAWVLERHTWRHRVTELLSMLGYP